MNFAYVLVSDSSDIYYEQFLVSLISLKHWNPDANVLVVIDDVTEKNLVDLRSRHLKYVDEIKVVNFASDKDKHYRSRYLKTTLRKVFTGDFLYLDSDTIVCDKIDETEFINDVMGVDDCHQLLHDNSNRLIFLDQIRQSGFSEAGLIHYINGGVLWMRDNDIARHFSTLWHELWLQSIMRQISVDMPSLNEANKRMNGVVGVLSGEYNCQISVNLRYLHYAKIIHCFATKVSNINDDKNAYYFLNPDFYREIKSREISVADEEKIINAKSAFDDGETILLGKRNSNIYINLSRTSLYGFIYCLFNSKRGRWLFDLMDKIVGFVTRLFWPKK